MVSRSYGLSGLGFSIRTTSRAFGAWLDRTLRRYRIRKMARPYYSIVIADGSGPRDFAKEQYHILYRGTIALVRTTDIHTLVTCLLSDLETFLYEDRDDAIYADMCLVSLDGANALVPATVVPFIATLGRRRLERTGLSLPVETSVAVDPSTGQVVPVKPLIRTTRDSLELLSDAVPGNGHRDDRTRVERATPVDMVLTLGLLDDPLAPLSKGKALYRVGSHVVNLDRLGGAALEGLRPLVQAARCFETSADKPKAILESILQAFRSL